MAKITGVTTKTYAVPFERLIGDANDPRGRDVTLQMVVEVHSDEGLTGMAIGHPGSREIVHEFASLIVGEDPASVRGLWQRMVDKAFKGGAEGIVKEAICHLDVAIWDLKAKVNDEPLWKTLGATSPKVLAYASGIDTPLTDEEIFGFYQSMGKLGIKLGKLKVGRDIEADIRRIGVMVDAFKSVGIDPLIAIDSNEYWTAKQAIGHIREIEKVYRLEWAEEPARRWDVMGLKKVSDQVGAAVATGENLNGTAEFLPLIQGGAADIVQIGQYTTGITGALQVAELAEAFELPVTVMNCPGDFMAHIASVIPNHGGVELVWGGMGRLVNNNQVVEDGWITLSSKPGLGLELRNDISQFEIGEEVEGKGVSTQGRLRKGTWTDYKYVETGSRN